MSSSRRRSPAPLHRDSDSLSPSPEDEPEPRRRESRSSGREVRISTGGGSGGSSIKASSSRARRPTPVVKRSSGGGGQSSTRGLGMNQREEDDESTSDSGREHGHNHHVHHGHQHQHQHRQRHQGSNSSSKRHVSIRTGANQGGRSRHMSVGASSANNSNALTWYERMVPECLLNMTAPLTGYEHALDPDLEDLGEQERELLEHARMRRNKRVRRRVFYIALAASLASAYFMWRGRYPARRPPGVRGAINSMAHKLEDGLTKTYQDTMGK